MCLSAKGNQGIPLKNFTWINILLYNLEILQR